MRYHINPETGEPGVCKAVYQCRFHLGESEHHNTKNDARKAYEKIATHEFGETPTLKKPKAFYHVTPKRNVQSILATGLEPKIGERSIQIDEQESTVYLFDSEDSAADAVSNWLGDEFDEDDELVLLKIPSETIEAKPSFEGDDSSFEWTTGLHIDASLFHIENENF